MKNIIKAALALALLAAFTGNSTFANAARPEIRIFGAKQGKTGDPKCQDYYGDCLILIDSDKPLRIKDYTYTSGEKTKPEILINLNETDSGQLTEMTKTYLGQSLAVMVGKVIVHSPKVRTVLTMKGMQLSFCDRRNYEVTKAALGGDVTALKRFKHFKGPRCKS